MKIYDVKCWVKVIHSDESSNVNILCMLHNF